MNPLLGDYPLSDIRSRAMKSLVERLVAKGLSASTIRNITKAVKLVVASVQDEDGNQLYPVKWNRRFIDAPRVIPRKQRRPTFAKTEVEQIVRATSGRLQMAVILLASTGVRVGELLGLECRHFDGSSIRVEQELWHTNVQEPKTENARRVVDLHPDAADLLKQFVGTNLARQLYDVLDELEIPRRGFHAFRRFRNTHLRNLNCPDGLLKYWMGHAPSDMSDRYDRVAEDTEFRKGAAVSLSVGFTLPTTLNSTRHAAAEKPKFSRRMLRHRALSGVTKKWLLL